MTLGVAPGGRNSWITGCVPADRPVQPRMRRSVHRSEPAESAGISSVATVGGGRPAPQTLLVFAGIAIPFLLRPFGASAIVAILLMPETARISITHPTAIPGRRPAVAQP